jgi:threonine/homoserine/homoserine lactone efflux protein
MLGGRASRAERRGTMFSLDFIITALIVVLIPGTGVIYTINTGILYKAKHSIAAAVGCTLGIIPHLIACILGLSAIMNLSAKVFSIIKMGGAFYLGYLAIKTWIYAGKTELGENESKMGLLKTAEKGIVINLLNPKLTIFFLSFLPQFIPVNTDNTMYYMIILSLVFMVMTLIVFIFYGVLANQASRVIRKNKKIMKTIEKGFACIFAGLALKLAFDKE